MTEGKNVLRILPSKEDGDPFYERFAIHYIQNGVEGIAESFLCIEPGGPFGHNKKSDKKRAYRAQRCPGCKKFCNLKSKSREFEFGSPAGLKFWRERVGPWRARLSFVMATIRPRSKQASKRMRPSVLRTGLQVAKPLLEAYYDEKGGGDFTNPRTGRNVKITKQQLSKRATDVKYETQLELDRSALEGWKKIKKRLPDLKSYVPEALSIEAIHALIDGDGDVDDRPRKKKTAKEMGFRSRDSGDADLDDEDDEDGEPRKLKTKRRERGKDEEVDPDAPEADDDGERKKKKKKKSKLRDKLAKRAGKDE